MSNVCTSILLKLGSALQLIVVLVALLFGNFDNNHYNNGEESEIFPVTNGVKQGYVIAPTLYSMMFSAMLTDAFNREEAGRIPFRYRVDGELFTLSRLMKKMKLFKAYLRDMLFARCTNSQGHAGSCQQLLTRL